MKDRLGLAFFTFAATLSALNAYKTPSILAWLAMAHNAFLAVLYVRRKPARRYDPRGLWLGILAGLLPLAAPYPMATPLFVLIPGILGYALVIWSLLTLKNSFGIAPADRGLITSGPYRFLRHPMYLGELVLRAALVLTSPNPQIAAALLIVLASIQVLRIFREEQVIVGYEGYARQVRYRLVPGVW